MKKRILTVIILVFSVMTLSSCKETGEQNTAETSVASTVETTVTTAPQTVAIPTESPTEKKKSNKEHYEFDENTYYSTPEGIFMKPATATNPDGESIIISNNDNPSPKAKWRGQIVHV